MASRDRLWIFEKTLSVTTTSAEEVIDGSNEVGLLGVRFDILSHDEGKHAGATIQDLEFKVELTEQNETIGGNTWQSPYASVLPSPAGTPVLRGNALHLGGFIARPGEKVKLFYRSTATAGPTSVRVRIVRTKLFDARHKDALS